MPTSSFDERLVLGANTERSWEVLIDVPRLVGWVSIVDDAVEIRRLEKYTAVLLDRLGPFRLRADLDIDVDEVEIGRHVHIRANGEDRQVASRISVDGELSLEPTDTGGTVLSIRATYEVSGRVATMGAGMIRKKADTLVREFLENADAALGSVA
ncbi:MAG: hypothetical protein GEV10_23555 [Streptosporangiales bacterium]|nr:hypothetical protein [Streptosporangiales bacterium]